VNSKIHIFLDIDGVLATSHQYYTNRKKWHDMYDCYRFDEKCVRVFNQILEKIDPVIILSSDWREKYSIEIMNEIFKWNSVNAVVNDFTPNLWGVKFTSVAQLEDCRADEILLYVHEHQIEKWIAIDDLDLSPWISEDHFVRTPRANEGIKQSGKKDKILSILLN